MRTLTTLALMLATTALVLGQGGTPVPKVDPKAAPETVDPKLEEILQGWEKTMGAVKGMVADLVRTRLDKTFGATEIFEGKAKFVRSSTETLPSRAMLDIKMKGKPEVFEKYVFTGTFLYEFRPSSKVIAVHTLPPPKPGAVADDNILGFIFGMKAADVKRRYHLTYVAPPPEDKWYHYVSIKPRHDADKAEFSEARLVLIRSSSMPRQFWFRQPNGDEMTWDFPRIDTGAEVPITEFAAPALPAGWKWDRLPAGDAAPRVMRHSGM